MFFNLEARADLRKMRDLLQNPAKRTSLEKYADLTKTYPEAVVIWKKFVADELPAINARVKNCRINWNSDNEGGCLRNPACKKDEIRRILSVRKEIVKSNLNAIDGKCLFKLIFKP